MDGLEDEVHAPPGASKWAESRADERLSMPEKLRQNNHFCRGRISAPYGLLEDRAERVERGAHLASRWPTTGVVPIWCRLSLGNERGGLAPSVLGEQPRLVIRQSWSLPVTGWGIWCCAEGCLAFDGAILLVRLPTAGHTSKLGFGNAPNAPLSRSRFTLGRSA